MIPAIFFLVITLPACASIKDQWDVWTGVIDTQTHRDRALTHLDAGDWEKARLEYQWVIDHYPKRPESESAKRWVKVLQKLSALQADSEKLKEENAQLKEDSEKLKETLKDLNRMERSIVK